MRKIIITTLILIFLIGTCAADQLIVTSDIDNSTLLDTTKSDSGSQTITGIENNAGLQNNNNDENLNKTKNKLSANDDGSSIATIRLVDTYGNVLINYDKKLVKGQAWTIQENNVANRIGHIQSEDGGLVNPSTVGARYVKNGRTYGILGYNSEFPVKATATGEDYTIDIILNVEPVDCYVTLTYVDNVTGETIRSTTNNILKGDSWIVEQEQFDNVVSNRMNITVEDRNYTFIDFNTSTPLIMEWQPGDYEVIVCLNYNIIVPEENDGGENETNDNTDSNVSNDSDSVDKDVNNRKTIDNAPVIKSNNETGELTCEIVELDKDKNNNTPIALPETGNSFALLISAALIIFVISLAYWRG